MIPSTRISFLFAAVLAVVPESSFSLVTETPDPQHLHEAGLCRILNTVMRPTQRFPFWRNVGILNQSTGVYLGYGYVLTAAHVGPGVFSLQDGSSYRPVAGSERRFRNSNGTFADLTLFRVSYRRDDLLAQLPTIPMRRTCPGRGASVVLVGAGSGNSADDVMSSSVDFRWNDNTRMRWGLNRVEYQYQDPIETFAFRTPGFSTRFSKDNFACQATPGDSGGAVFAFNPMFKRWELCGVILAVDGSEGSAAYGNHTYIGDLSMLPAQIPNTPSFLASW